MMMELKRSNWNVVDIETRPGHSHNDMGEGLVRNWARGDDIIICGQDNVCAESQIMEMLYCKYEACAIPCLMYPASTALPGVYQNQISHGKMHSATSMLEFVEGDWGNGDPWFIGTGISRFKADIQERTKAYITPENCYFGRLDTGITQALDRVGIKRGHLHYPLHRHNKTEMENSHWKK